MVQQEESSHVLPQKFGGGPHGVGKHNENFEKFRFLQNPLNIYL